MNVGDAARIHGVEIPAIQMGTLASDGTDLFFVTYITGGHANFHVNTEDPIQGTHLLIEFVPTYYTRLTDEAPNEEDRLVSHLDGIDAAIGDLLGPIDPHAPSHAAGQSDPVQGDLLAVDYAPTDYTPGNGTVGGHLSGIDARMHGEAGVADHNLLGGVTPTDHHNNANDPSTDQKAAMVGTEGVPGIGNEFVTDEDSRLLPYTGPPEAHGDSHVEAGSDELQADWLQVDYLPTHYTRDISVPEAQRVTDFTAHLAGVDNALLQLSPDPQVSSIATDIQNLESNMVLLFWQMESVDYEYSDVAVDLFDSTDNIDLGASSGVTYDADGNFCKYTPGGEMDLIMDSWEASANDPSEAYAMAAVELVGSQTPGVDFKVSCSIDDGATYVELPLRVIREVNGVITYRGDASGITPQGDKTMRFRYQTFNSGVSNYSKLYGTALGVRYAI